MKKLAAITLLLVLGVAGFAVSAQRSTGDPPPMCPPRGCR
jgi:hypothetical protein